MPATRKGLRLPFVSALLTGSLALALPPSPPATPHAPRQEVRLANLPHGGPVLDGRMIGHLTFQLKPYLEEATQALLGPLSLDLLVYLGPSSAVCAVDALEPHRHFLVYLRLNPEDLYADPLHRHWEVPAKIRAQQVLARDQVLAILADGSYRIFTLDEPQPTTLGRWLPEATRPEAVPELRDVAVAPWPLQRFALGGGDGMLAIHELNRPHAIDCMHLNAPIGSIHWGTGGPSGTGGELLSAALDPGVLLIFDLRSSLQTSDLTLGKRLESRFRGGLYAHLFLEPCRVLLGFGMGYLELWDLRQPDQSLASGVDPHVRAVGQFDRNDPGDRVVVSGRSDFSVYTHGPEGMTYGFHALPDLHRVARPQEAPLQVCARCGAPGEIWTVDSTGSLSLFLEDQGSPARELTLEANLLDEPVFATGSM